MSTTAPARTTAATAPASPAAVTRALARAEAGKLLRQPVLAVGAILALLTMTRMTWEQAPVLQYVETGASGALLVLAAAALLAANGAALRSRQRGAEEMLAVTPTPLRARTLALLQASLAPAGVAVLVLAAHLVSLLPAGPVGRLHPAELLTGPVLVGLGAALGVALARWLPLPAVAPVVVVGLAALELGVNFGTTGLETGGRARWLIPFVGNQGVPPELVLRPTGWHLAYLVALGLAAGAAALASHRPAGRALALGAVALVMLVATAAVQLRPPSAQERARALAPYVGPGRVEQCVTRSGVTYCALPTYRPWVDRWASAVEPVLAWLPGRARSSPPTVRQRLEPALAAEDPAAVGSDVDPGLSWGRGGAARRSRFSLALDFSASVVGLPVNGAWFEPDGGSPGGAGTSYFGRCSAAGQSRAVVALWLAGQAGDLGSFLGTHGYAAGMVQMGWREVAYARQLLEQPREDVGRRVLAHWDELTARGTGSQRAAALLALRPPAGPAPAGLEQVEEAPCP